MPSSAYQPGEPASSTDDPTLGGHPTQPLRVPETRAMPAASPPPAGYPPPVYPGYHPGPPNHSGATVALIMGIVGLVAIPFLAPVAWMLGNNALREIDAAPPGAYGNRDHAKGGRILGMVGTALLALIALLFVGFFVIWAVMMGVFVSTSS